MKPVQCPTCDLQWNIPDDAPRIITCPRCLAALNNPYLAAEAPSTTQVPAPSAVSTPSRPPPLRVLPIETQVQRDSRVSAIGTIVIAVIILFGLLCMFAAGV